MKILVTGGAGFIGSNFVRFLVNQNEIFDSISNITILDKLTYAGSKKNLDFIESSKKLKFIQGDIGDEVLLNELISDNLVIVNFAAESHVDNSIQSSKAFLNSNVAGIGNLLEICKNRKKIRFVQISTDEVYGSKITGDSIESDELLPNSPYAATKAAADLLCRAFQQTFGIDIVICRSCNNFGPFQHQEKFIPKIIHSIFSKSKIPIYGNGINIREWIPVQKSVDGIWKCVKSGKSGQIYNLGSGLKLSNMELLKEIRKVVDFSEDLIEFVADRKGHDVRYSLNSSKARDELGFAPMFSLSEELLKTIDHFKKVIA